MDIPIPAKMDTKSLVSETIEVSAFTAVGEYDVFGATGLVVVVVFTVISVCETKSLF